MGELRIGELARRTGVAASALRFYEAEGLLPPARRVSGRRRYDEHAVVTVRLIRAAQDTGFTLKEVRALFRDAAGGTPLAAGWRKQAARKLQELDELERRVRSMKAALRAGLECGCLQPEDCRLLAAPAAQGQARTARKSSRRFKPRPPAGTPA